jgi:radical SAM superfamily enzyme YgiQ (UPF0313 family)
MKVVFLQNDSFVKLAVEQLSAVLKINGHECDSFVETGERDFIGAALKSKADLFAFSCSSGSESWVISTSREIKRKSSIPIIVGGPHATFYPEIIENSSIDYVCRGEGEYALLDLLEAMKHDSHGIKNIPNIWSKDTSGNIYKTDVRPFIEDLDKLPIPDFGIYTKYRFLIPYYKNMYPIIARRGCPYNCSYCFNKTYKEIYRGKGKYLRKRSPENVTKELLHAKNTHNITKINFLDDCFLVFPDWLEEFSKLYKRDINLPFIIQVEASQVTEKLVRLIKGMGCICVNLGLETADDDMRWNVLNKKVSTQQIKEAAGLFKRHGIKLYTYNMLGLPGETLDQAIETYKLNKEIGSDFAWCSLVQPYPGTALTQYVKDHGLLVYDNVEPAVDDSYFLSSKIKLENEKAITNLQKMMQFFIQVRMPLFWVQKIINLPKNPIFDLIFKMELIYNKIRIHKTGLMPTIMLSLHSLSFMRRKCSHHS